MGSPPIRSLADVPGLEKLSVAANSLGVNVTAHGSLLRHLVSHCGKSSVRAAHGETVIVTPADRLELFDITPFTSDIDLIHSGDDTLTARLYEAILNTVPFAECFRWQLISANQDAERVQALRCSAIIPANLMTLSTASRKGIHDPWRGADDIQSSSYRFIRNGFFTGSPLYHSLRDMEVFSTLHYFRILLSNLDSIEAMQDQPGFQSARDVVLAATADQDTALRLQRSDYLRARTLYLSQSLFASARSFSVLQVFLDKSGLKAFYTFLGRQLPGWPLARLTSLASTDGAPGTGIVVSNWLGGDHFRCDTRTTFSTQVDSVLQTAKSLSDQHSGPFPTLPLPPRSIVLATNHEPLCVSESMAIVAGHAPSAIHEGGQPPLQGNEPPPRRDEFLHLAISISGTPLSDLITKFRSEDITAILLVSDVASAERAVLPLPTVAQFSPGDVSRQWLYLRMNCFGCLHELAEFVRDKPLDESLNHRLSARVVVVAWQYREEPSPTILSVTL